MRNNKVTGRDGTPAEALKILVTWDEETVKCLEECLNTENCNSDRSLRLLYVVNERRNMIV